MKLPKGWGEVTIKTYLQIHTINKTITDELERGIQIIAALFSKQPKEIEALKVTEIMELTAQLTWLRDLPKEKIPMKFDLDGRKWQAIIFQHEMTAGQFIDYSSVVDRVKRENEDMVYSIHDFLACFCVPQDEKGEYTYMGCMKESQIIHDKMTMDIAYPFFVFFSNVWIRFSPHIQRYFLKQSRKNLKLLKKELKKMAA